MDPIPRREFFRHGLRQVAKVVADTVTAGRKEMGRRGGERSSPAPEARLLRPPGAINEMHFLEKCTRCDACFKACPVECLVPVPEGGPGPGTPQILASTAACAVCTSLACTKVCEPGALLPLNSPREIDIGMAAINQDLCHAYQGTWCEACVAICPTQPKALTLINGKPSLVEDFCIGCGLCEEHCPTWPKAVVVSDPGRDRFHSMRKAEATPAPVVKEERRTNRKVEPVAEDFDDETRQPMATLPRPLAALLLVAGPVLSGFAVLGFGKLLMAAPLAQAVDFHAGLLLRDLLLLMLFIVPHTLFARGYGRRWLNHPLGPCGERPLYVLIASTTLFVMVTGWRTTGPVLWDLTGAAGLVARVVQFTGFGLIAWAGLVVGGAFLLGLPHLRALARGRKEPSPEFVALPPYSLVRQPINLGILMALASMPEVTVDRFLLAVSLGAWILLTAPYEERDAELIFGDGYRIYKERTPRWLPRLRRSEP